MCAFRINFVLLKSKLFAGYTDLIFLLDLSDLFDLSDLSDLSDFFGQMSTNGLQQIKYWLMNMSTSFPIKNFSVGVITYNKMFRYINK